MGEQGRELTEAQKGAIAFLKRPRPNLYNWLVKEIAKESALKPGQLMPDGTVFAGMTLDGKQIFAMPTDLDVTMTFNEAVQRVKELNAQNAYSHNDWVIPEKGLLYILYQNKDKGALANTFKTVSSGSDYPVWYWSSTENPYDQDDIYNVRFSDGYFNWNDKEDNRLSCRPVCLIAPKI